MLKFNLNDNSEKKKLNELVRLDLFYFGSEETTGWVNARYLSWFAKVISSMGQMILKREVNNGSYH